jgi:predicted nucleotidyltransferase
MDKALQYSHSDYKMNSDIIIKTVVNFYPDVEAIYIFGSHGTEDEWPDSDVDIALLFSPSRAKEVKNLALSDCCLALAAVLKKDVDLINLRQVNTVFQREIILDGRIIYNKDENTVDYFEMAVLSAYQKLNEERAGILQEISRTGRILDV